MHSHTTCETVNKSGIVIICYLDSEPTGYILNIKELLLSCLGSIRRGVGVPSACAAGACHVLFNHDKYIEASDVRENGDVS